MFHHPAWAVGSYSWGNSPSYSWGNSPSYSWGNSPNRSQPNPAARPAAPPCRTVSSNIEIYVSTLYVVLTCPERVLVDTLGPGSATAKAKAKSGSTNRIRPTGSANDLRFRFVFKKLDTAFWFDFQRIKVATRSC